MEAAYRKSLVAAPLAAIKINPTTELDQDQIGVAVDGEVKESVLDNQLSEEVKKQTASQW